jgi:hypothetical protein
VDLLVSFDLRKVDFHILYDLLTFVDPRSAQENTILDIQTDNAAFSAGAKFYISAIGFANHIF